MITMYDTIDAVCNYVENMGGKCQTYRDYWNFLQEHHVDTSQFPLPLGYFSFEQFMEEIIDEDEYMKDTEEDIIRKASKVTNDTVVIHILKCVKELGGSCNTLQESIQFLRDHNVDFSTFQLPKGCKDFNEFEQYLIESEKLAKEMEENFSPNALNDPNISSFDF